MKQYSAQLLVTGLDLLPARIASGQLPKLKPRLVSVVPVPVTLNRRSKPALL